MAHFEVLIVSHIVNGAINISSEYKDRLDKILLHNDQFGLELRPWQMITEEDCPDQSVAQKEHHHPPSFVRVELLLVMKSYFEFTRQIFKLCMSLTTYCRQYLHFGFLVPSNKIFVL